MTEHSLGLVRTGGLDLALPLSALREVVPCPDELVPVPASTPGLLGVLSLRQTVVPVVDLVHLLGRPHARAHGQVVLVVAHSGRVVGLLADEVRGLATVPADAMAEVVCDGGAPLWSRTFHHPELGHVVSLLDPDALMALPGVPSVLASAGTTATTSTAGPARSLTLVRCGAFTLAVDVAHVHSTVPSPALSASVVDGPTCLGVTSVAGSDVAVVDPLALLGLGSLAGTPLGCGLVLDLPDGQVVLGVTEMVGLHDVPGELVVPLPAAASPDPALLAEVADVPEVGPCLLLDGVRLLASDAIVSFSRVATPTGDAAAAVSRTTGVRGPAHLSYRAGVDVATDLTQVVEVLAHPTDMVPSTGAPGALGVVVHRGTAVPVLCLAQLLGRAPEPVDAASRLLLLQVDGEPVAYAVATLHAITPLTWSDPSPAAGSSTDPLRSCPLVQLEGRDGLLPALDLHALTRELRGTLPAVPAQRTPHEALADA